MISLLWLIGLQGNLTLNFWMVPLVIATLQRSALDRFNHTNACPVAENGSNK